MRQALALLLLGSLACAVPARAQHYVAGPDSLHPRLKFADSLVSVNHRCIVSGSKKIERLLGDIYHVVSPEGWEGVGILEGSIYRGVFRYRGRDPKLNGAMGLHVIDWSNLHEPRVRTTNAAAMADTSNETWHRIEASREPAYANPDGQNRNIVVAPPNSSERPKFGEYVYVDELPEAITKVPRAYPDEARRAGIEGTVMVQCLVLEDGSVGDTWVVKSVPELDEAAVACVRQWRFQPARSKGRPVAVWVAVPVRFSLH
ncbi:MAG: energy transducer TonB [Candidatus Eisenbacteria bacterium]|uniref:Energy transducer TonB n=1 Tax=Eiseniibacteriota bacterium TaxID=2212470 RepID=A0A538SAH7_UNCEI|nr:MAG: energy transducer TonB [Candidatus Eisenbacteria bacterium]